MPVSPVIAEGMIAASLAAGRAIMEIYASDFASRSKADKTPVTEADETAEAIILAALDRLLPDVAVVAEESVAAGRIPSIGKRFFLVDPLDGTKEFINRRDEFTVNIALIEDGRPIAGVVYAPALGRLFAGTDGGAVEFAVENFQLAEARPISVTTAGATVRVVASRSHRTAETDRFIEQYPGAETVTAGSSLKFCLVAAGAADLYPRLGRTMEWDTAAGHAVLAAAGGIVVRTDGTPLDYGRAVQPEDAPFANPWFIAASDARLVEAGRAVL
ncbi:MAG: 3'(2'),5'-bisphosphate nucleotidase CysQ [Hyphomicrobiales bacterium]